MLSLQMTFSLSRFRVCVINSEETICGGVGNPCYTCLKSETQDGTIDRVLTSRTVDETLESCPFGLVGSPSEEKLK